MFKLHYFKRLSSTNDKAKEFSEGDVIIADVQTKGRGRGRRGWRSGEGGVWLSIVLMPRTENIWELTFIAAVAVQRAVKEICGLETKIKWPNDILYKGRKMCGILTEVRVKGKEKMMAVGIGLNVNNELNESLRSKGASLKGILNKDVDRKKIINGVLKEFESLYNEYNSKGFGRILEEWRRLCMTIGREVKVVSRGKAYCGKVVGVDDSCRLVMRLKNGSVKRIIEGSVTFID